MTLAGSETALRLTGAGAKQAAAALMAVAASREQSKGRARLGALLKSGKELSVFTLPPDQLKPFAQEAKRYGVLYTVVKERDADGPVDLIVRAEDASKINRIIDRLELGTVKLGGPTCEDAARVSASEARRDTPAQAEGPDTSREVAAAPQADPADSSARERQREDGPPLPCGPERGHPSGPTSETERRSGGGGSEKGPVRERPSVRKRINEIERGRRAQAARGGGEPRARASRAPAQKERKGGQR